MKRLIAISLLTLALLAAGLSTTTAQDFCGPCMQEATRQQNMAFNSCRDGEGCIGADCANCVSEGISAKYDYVNSSCPICGNMLIDGKK